MAETRRTKIEYYLYGCLALVSASVIGMLTVALFGSYWYERIFLIGFALGLLGIFLPLTISVFCAVVAQRRRRY